MLNKLFGKLSGQSRKKGFTMTELLTVVGIIAIVCAIAIPAIISISRSLAFKQANEYAESIFMAAQANLTEMKSDGRLIDLFVEDNGAKKVGDDAVNTGFPNDEIHREQYMYATSSDGVYDVLLPATSIDSDARDGNVLIEYNPYTGNVYSVFYKDGGDPLGYTEGDGVTKVTRNEEERRDLKLGYYCGSALSTEPLTPEETKASIGFINGEEFIVQVIIPIPQSYKSNPNVFADGLAVDLTVTGENGDILGDKTRTGDGSFTTQIKARNDRSSCKPSSDGKSVIVSYTLDSLMDKQSFANYGRLVGDVSPASDAAFAKVAPMSVASKPEGLKTHLVEFEKDEFNIYPGENVKIEANINFQSSSNRNSVKISSDTLSNVNPMFDVLMKGKNGWVISVSNGRNLQNLNALSATVAKSIKTVSFANDIDWNDTVTYYKEKYTDIFVDKTDFPEAPARALPYFVPIHNENLFGTAQFVYRGDGNGLWAKVIEILQKIFNTNLDQESDVPTLTDELDITSVDENTKAYKCKPHATVSGNGHKVLNIKIDSTQYALGKNFYAGKTASANTDKFTGLFGYVNTTIDSLSVVNPIIKGNSFSDKNNPATGALVGATGFNTLITNCSAYIDTDIKNAGFNRSLLPGGASQQWKQFDTNKDDASYGVKGYGAVGGLVGYAKSHRTVTGELTNDKNSLAFSNCFAAVPVSGHMRGTAVAGTNGKHYGYTNGVGGLVGNAEISNFYNCYASGDVVADGIYVDYLNDLSGIFKEIADTIAPLIGVDPPDLFYNGRTSIGAGGFVGTSHGVRYTNCFASGDVIGENCSEQEEAEKKGAAGFAGIMSYEETHLYGNDDSGKGEKTHADIAQMTVFQNCYAVGTAKSLKNGSTEAASIAESFSGANCRIKFDGFAGTATKYWGGSYYQTYAPWWYGANGDIVNGIERLPYESFIFKDSYYISKYTTLDKDQTNACASPLMYESFEDLTGMQNDPEWQKKQIEVIKEIKTSGLLRLLGDKASGDDDKYAPTRYNFGGIYFGEWLNEDVVRDVDNWLESLFFEEYSGKRYAAPARSFLNGPKARNILSGKWLTGFPECVRTKGYIANNDNNSSNNISSDKYEAYYANDLYKLEAIYETLYSEGFSSEYWQAGGNGKTFAYDETALNQNAKYPFTKLNGLDYYGRWPAKQIACGIAYYEQYGEKDYGYYFDRAGTSTLQDKPVISDGYAILTGNQTDDVRIVEINGQEKDIELKTTNSYYTATYTTGDSVYCVYRLPWEALQEASSDSFYTEIKVTVNDEKTYTLYFNPNVALSQVNPEDKGDKYPDSKFTAKEPETLPAQVYIRSARQLAALGKSTMNAYTANENINFVQQLDIDASKYTGESYGADAEKAKNAAVNNASVASFGAAYTGKTASEKSPIISGFANPIFTVIDKTGSVSDLAISCSGNHGSTDVKEAGLLAVTNNGTVTNVDVNISTGATVTAKTSAGLLIGVNSGTISNCDATVGATATVKADENAGGLIGINSGKVENCTANITGTMKVNATNAGGIVGMAMPGSIFNNVEVSGKNLAGNGSLGAFAGTLDTANVSNVTVNINGAFEAQNTAAGLAGIVTSGILSNITVSVAENASIEAPTAAGLIGTASDASIGALKLELKGKIIGEESAVGAISDITGGSTSNVKVLLSVENAENAENAKITAPNNAAGFTLNAHSNIQDSYVIGKGTIEATATDGNAAGFAVSVNAAENTRVFNCFVSPADHTKTDLAAAYRAAKLDDLKISATGANGNAAGFAVNVSGVVDNSTALGKINGTNAAGFVVNVNGGAITGCMANTDTNGKAFAANNNGLVSNSYAWYQTGTADEIAKDDNNNAQHYYACYFAPLRFEPAPQVTVVKGRAVDKISYDELAELPLNDLCPISDVDAPVDGNIWKLAGKDVAYPFSEMHPSNYAYPMLREHYGDWVNPTQYAYGIVYYEKYTDGTIGMNLVDVSYIDANKTRQHYSMNTLADDTKTITEAGYALFFHNHKQIKDITLDDKNVNGYVPFTVNPSDLANLKLGEKDADITSFLANYEFRILPVKQDAESTEAVTEAVKIYGLDDGVHMFVPAFANAITPNWTAPDKDVKATYEIRTAAQFGNINKSLGDAAPAEGFTQTHSFTLNGNSNIETFKSLSYDGGNHEITVGAIKHGLFGVVSGTAEANAVIKNVKLTGAKLNATTTAGIIADTVDKYSEITNVTLNDPAIEIAVTDYTDNTSVDVGAVVGKNSGTIKNAAIMMSQRENADGNAEKDEHGNVLRKTFTIDASKTKLTATQLKLNVGGIVGSNEGSITADKVNGKLKTSVTGNIEFTPASVALDDSGKALILDSTKNKTVLSELVKVGGIAGENSGSTAGENSGSVTGENSGSVTGDMNGDLVYKTFKFPADTVQVELTNEIKLGGLVGHSTSDNSNGASVTGTVTGNVHYTRPAVIADKDNAESDKKTVTDGVMLGGLVGESESSVITGSFNGESESSVNGKSVEILKAVGDDNKKIFVKDVDTVSVENYIGGLVGQMNGGSFGNTVSASGAVKLDYSVGESYTGGIAGYVNNSAVNNANTNLDITVSTANAGLYAGGLVGRMNGNTLTGSASGNIVVTGSATNAYIGGAVGNTGGVSVTNVTSNSKINVNLGNGTRYVGGLVGYMNGGSMRASDKNTASATGEITVSNVNANTYVGGAVGYEKNATRFTNIKADVAITGSWTPGETTASCPSGYANVGKFIGNANNDSSHKVTFSHCSGVGNSDIPLQFLGSINYTATNTGANWYWSAEPLKGTLVSTRYKNAVDGNTDYIIGGNTLLPKNSPESTPKYYNYTATLTDCTYSAEDGTYKQEINKNKYFYDRSTENLFEEYSIKQVTFGPLTGKYMFANTSKKAIYDNGGDFGVYDITSLVNGQKFNNEDVTATAYKAIWNVSGNKNFQNMSSGRYISRNDGFWGMGYNFSLVNDHASINNAPVGGFSGGYYGILSQAGKKWVSMVITDSGVDKQREKNKNYNLLVYQVNTASYYKATFTNTSKYNQVIESIKT